MSAFQILSVILHHLSFSFEVLISRSIGIEARTLSCVFDAVQIHNLHAIEEEQWNKQDADFLTGLMGGEVAGSEFAVDRRTRSTWSVTTRLASFLGLVQTSPTKSAVSPMPSSAAKSFELAFMLLKPDCRCSASVEILRLPALLACTVSLTDCSVVLAPGRRSNVHAPILTLLATLPNAARRCTNPRSFTDSTRAYP